MSHRNKIGILLSKSHHHYHRLAAEQVTTSFLQLQWSWAIANSCRWSSMSFRSSSRHWVYLQEQSSLSSRFSLSMPWDIECILPAGFLNRQTKNVTQEFKMVSSGSLNKWCCFGQVTDGDICYSVNPLDIQHYFLTWSTKCINLVFHSLGDDPWFTVIQQNCDASCIQQSDVGGNWDVRISPQALKFPESCPGKTFPSF